MLINTRYLVSDLTSVTTTLVPHIVTCHLSSLLYTLIPLSLAAGLVTTLTNMVTTSTVLVISVMVPLVPVIIGAVIMTVRALRKYPKIVVGNLQFANINTQQT